VSLMKVQIPLCWRTPLGVLSCLLVLPLLSQGVDPAGKVVKDSPASWQVQLLDGGVIAAKSIGLDQAGVLPGDGRPKIPFDRILCLLGPGRMGTDAEGAVVDLVDGSRFVGAILGGDEEGESFGIKTVDFGVLQISLDLVATIRFRRKGRLPQVPEESEGGGETLLRWSQFGHDAVGGFLASVAREGLMFSEKEDEDPSLVPWKEVAGLRFDNEIPKDQAHFAVVGMGGSLIRMKKLRQEKGLLLLSHAVSKDLALPIERLVTLVPLQGGGRLFATSLASRFEEKSFFGKDGAKFGYQQNRNLFGDLLVSEGLGFPLGFAAHSWSRITIEVPVQRTQFRVFLGIDQTAREFPIPGNLDGRILVDGKVMAEAKQVQGGQPLRVLSLKGLRPGQELTLELDFGADLHIGDRGDWLLPVFLP